MTTIPSTFTVVYDPDLVDPELAGFLGGYRGLTCDAYALNLRQSVAFCAQRHLDLFEVRRSDIEASDETSKLVVEPRPRSPDGSAP